MWNLYLEPLNSDSEVTESDSKRDYKVTGSDYKITAKWQSDCKWPESDYKKCLKLRLKATAKWLQSDRKWLQSDWKVTGKWLQTVCESDWKWQ